MTIETTVYAAMSPLNFQTTFEDFWVKMFDSPEIDEDFIKRFGTYSSISWQKFN